MSKAKRQLKIREIISRNDIDTQDELVDYLEKSGFTVTQATVSRDIKELRLVKVPAKNGKYKYSLPEASNLAEIPEDHSLKRLERALIDTFINVENAGNLVVLKTIPGNAHAIGALIDQTNWDEILGCVCGDDTCLIVTGTTDDASDIKMRIRNLVS